MGSAIQPWEPAPAVLTKAQSWRFEVFVALGVPLDDAEPLALSRASLEEARSLVGAGCPPALLMRLLG